MLVMIQVIVLWSVVPHDCRKLVIDHIVLTCPFLSLLVGEGVKVGCVRTVSLIESCVYICVVVTVVGWGERRLRAHCVVDIVSLSL